MPGFEPAAQEAWGLFWQIFVADKGRRTALMSELGLAPVQCQALMQLHPDEPQPMRALADAMHCDNSNVTGIIDRLENAGLVERRASERDRRVKEILLTDKGQALRERALAALSVPPAAIAALGREDAETLRDILERALAAGSSVPADEGRAPAGRGHAG